MNHPELILNIEGNDYLMFSADVLRAIYCGCFTAVAEQAMVTAIVLIACPVE